eukprot:966111_1
MGGYYVNTVSILLLDTVQWLNNVPSMQIKRAYHSCNIDPDTYSLYAIGGYTNSVEMINIDNIIQNTWHILEETLSTYMSGIRSICINNKIYVFQCGQEVNIINTNTQSITIATDRLPISSYGLYCPVIVFDNAIYLLTDAKQWLINNLTIPLIHPTMVTMHPTPQKIATKNYYLWRLI